MVVENKHGIGVPSVPSIMVGFYDQNFGLRTEEEGRCEMQGCQEILLIPMLTR